jgi:hypothetical protein
MKSKPGHIVGEDKIASSDRGRGWGMRHTSTALYFYGASKKTLHKPTSPGSLLEIYYLR